MAENSLFFFLLIPGGYEGKHEKAFKTKCPALWWKKSFAS
jgi:hypothetical protein